MNLRDLTLILMAFLMTFLTGCGTLRVQVDVADPGYIHAEVSDESLRKTYRHILHAQPGDLAAQVDWNFTAYQREVGELSKLYKELAASYPEAEKNFLTATADDLVIAVSKGTIFEEKERAGTEIESQAQAIREMNDSAQWSGRGAVPPTIREMLLAFEAETKKLSVILQRDIRELAAVNRQLASRSGGALAAPEPDSPAVPPAVVQQEARAQAVAQRSIIQGAELSNTEYAHVVASTPEELWRIRYNEAYGRGTLGNVDVVIRMNSTADFSVKGMRFDASTVAQVASKVMTQSLLLGAQMAGVPVGTGTSGTQTGGDALSTQSSELASLEQSLAQREASSEAQRSAIRILARNILSVAPRLESGDLKDEPSDDASRSALHDSVENTVSAMKPLLSLQSLQ